MSTIKGKALLVIDRWGENQSCGGWRGEVHAFIQSCSSAHWGAYEAVQEMFQHMEYDLVPLPPAAYKMPFYGRIRVVVTYEVSFSADYFGEHDSNLEITKSRVLRKQFPKERYFRRTH